MSLRRLLPVVLAASCLLLGPGAFAAEQKPFTTAAFEAAQKAGKPVLVHITAPWCTVCAQQKPIVAKLEADPRFKDLTVFDVDFDTQKEAVRQLGARMQSTLIAYKGDKETARSVGETKPGPIEGVFAKTL